MVHDLLVEPILGWRDDQRRRGKATLPGLLARLASGELADFPRVRTHQLDPWCMFLTQLAGIALRRAGSSDPQASEETWRQMLLALTQGTHEPWTLVVPDLSKPAFFQPPVPEGTTDDWNSADFPDDIDLLATAKAHDVKTSLIGGEDVEAWIYAIVALQTMQGVYGSGKYGVSRMKGGYACRPRIGYAADHSLAARFERDVEVLLSSWPDLIESHSYRDDGVSLVWIAPWDGTVSLPAPQLSPHFIEVCRRIRCVERESGITCRYTTSKGRRCLAETKDGDVGDPWIPVRRGGGALNVSGRGFRYDVLADLLSEEDFHPPPAQRLRAGDGDPVVLLASALARGEGGTAGLHSRALLLTGPVRRRIGEPDGRALVGARAKMRVARTAIIRANVLYAALKRLAAAGEPIGHDLDARVDEMFFDHLFDTLTMSDDDARLAFDGRLVAIAREELQRAIRSSAIADARRYKAMSDAERMFEICLKKHFPDATALAEAGDGVPA